MSKAFFLPLFQGGKKISIISFAFFFAVSPVLAQEVPPAETTDTTAPSAVVQYTLTYGAGIGGTLAGTLSQTVDAGADGSAVTAVPESGYAFVMWSDASTDNPRTDIGVSADLSVTANFEAVVPPADPTGASSDSETPPAEPVVTEETPAAEEEAVSVEETESLASDYELYKKYLLFQKYEKRELYKKYARYKELAGKYPWENKKAEKKAKKKLKSDYKKYKKNPSRYPHLVSRASDYQNYNNLKAEYFSLKQYAGYADYARYDKPEYESYKEYGTDQYKSGYERYMAALAAGTATETLTEEELPALGPDIAVGIFNYIPRDLKEASFSITGNRPFKVKDRKNKTVGEIPVGTKVRVKYLGGDDREFRVYYSGTDEQIDIVSKEVRFVADDQYENDIVFDVSRPNSSFDHYRGSIRLRYYDSPEADGDRVWVINRLPLEHYVWGMGEITGTGPGEYNRVMTTIFRTYGYWKIQWSTKYADQGFKVDATSGSQIYYGYDWEKDHTSIREAAIATEGKLVLYQGEVALTPYSSWTDGKTRRFEDGHWGHVCDQDSSSKPSSIYPWLSSVPDPRGKHETKGTCELASLGNHMVGLSANGAVRMAKYDNSTYSQILEHFYSGTAVARGY